jgi:hypothetical protein
MSYEVQPTSNQDLGGGGGREGGREGKRGTTTTTTTTTNDVQPNRKVTRIKQQLRFHHVTTKDVQRKKSWWVRTTRASEKLNKNRRKKGVGEGKVVLKINKLEMRKKKGEIWSKRASKPRHHPRRQRVQRRIARVPPTHMEGRGLPPPHRHRLLLAVNE